MLFDGELFTEDFTLHGTHVKLRAKKFRLWGVDARFGVYFSFRAHRGNFSYSIRWDFQRGAIGVANHNPVFLRVLHRVYRIVYNFLQHILR